MTSIVRGMEGANIYIGSVQTFEYGILGPFEKKAVVLRYSPADADVDVDLGVIAVGVAMGEGPTRGQEPIGVLAAIMNQVTERMMEPLAGMITLR